MLSGLEHGCVRMLGPSDKTHSGHGWSPRDGMVKNQTNLAKDLDVMRFPTLPSLTRNRKVQVCRATHCHSLVNWLREVWANKPKAKQPIPMKRCTMFVFSQPMALVTAISDPEVEPQNVQ